MEKQDQPLISIISVNFNHSHDTILMIKSLKNCSYKNIEIIIVDNGSYNDSPTEITNQFPDVKLILLPDNLGFAGGNNEGFRYATGEYILLLNNDTEVDPSFLEPLIATFNEYSDAGMVSPRLLYFHSPDKKTIQYAGANRINLISGRGSNIGWGEIDNGQYNSVYKTDYAHGAALMLSRKVLNEVGCMPDVFFLYYEEHDWCTAMKKKGLNPYYVGTSKVYHKESVSVGKNSPIKTFYMTRNRIIYLRRNADWLSFYLAMFFFFFISVPFAIVRMTKNKEFHLFQYFFSGISWNFKNFKGLKGYPKLVSKEGTLPEIINSQNNYKMHSAFIKSINTKL